MFKKIFDFICISTAFILGVIGWGRLYDALMDEVVFKED